jgi:hypothetical protein
VRSHEGGNIAGRRLKRLVFLSLVAALAASALPPRVAAGTLDQSQTAVSLSNAAVGSPAEQDSAQTFTAGLSGSLDQVDLAVSRLPHSGSCKLGLGITVEIRTATAGFPTDSTLASANLPPDVIAPSPPEPPFVSVSFAAPTTVTAGTQYAIVLSAPGTSCDTLQAAYGWHLVSGNPYSGGRASWKNEYFPNWEEVLETDLDAAFKTYVATSSSAPPPSSVTPSNSISLGKPVLNKAKGTATVPVFVPGAGVVTLRGKGVVKQRREKVTAGIVNMLVKPAGKTKRKLNTTGKAKVKITVTYTPTGGSTSSKSKSLVLKRR